MWRRAGISQLSQLLVETDLLVGGTFEQHIGDSMLSIEVEDGIKQMVKVAEHIPRNIVIVKGISGHI